MIEKEIHSATSPLQDEIDRILTGKVLRRSDQLRKLLIYLGEVASDEDPAALSELTIGTRVFGRKDFNPKLDTIVRSEMLRLRRKLDEYYAEEDTTSSRRLAFEKNSYRPILAARSFAEVETLTTTVEVLAPPPAHSRTFTQGLLAGLGVAAVLAAIWTLAHRPAPSPLTTSPLWKNFAATDVEVLVGTPLFFRNNRGFERSFSLNFPEDLPQAEKQLGNWPAHPYWDIWAPFQSVGASVSLAQALSRLDTKTTFRSARDRSIGTLAGRKTIIIGHPRFAPLLADLLVNEIFRTANRVTGGTFGGFINTARKPGEAPSYATPETTLEQRSDESMPDYALISSQILPDGGEVLSIFGDRVQTAGFLVNALLEKPLLDQLNEKVFAGRQKYQTAQIVLRVDYSKREPIGAVYVTHRFR